jgi:Rrf2 family protein
VFPARESGEPRAQSIRDIGIVNALHPRAVVFSQTVEDALRATLYVASQQGKVVRVAQIARQVRASRAYLAKILSQLAAAGVLESTRGPHGGFRLAASPETLTLAGIAGVFDSDAPRRCLLGLGVCGRVTRCAVHERWTPVSRTVDAFLVNTTVSDLLLPNSTLA